MRDPCKRSSPRLSGNNHRAEYLSSSSIIAAFQKAMAAAGIETDAPIEPDGILHRVHVAGHKKGTQNAAYILHGDRFPVGWFMDFVSGASGTWTTGGGQWRMDEATKAQIQAEKARRQAEQEQRHAEKAAEAYRIWNPAAPADDGHPYLTGKGVKAHPGVKLGTWRKWILDDRGKWTRLDIPNCLLIPLFTPEGKLSTLQAIPPELNPAIPSGKDFLSGGRKAGCSFRIGAETPTVLIAEGYATTATLHERTGHQSVMAVDADNLKAVALIVRKLRPDAAIILCADNDRHTPGNPGVTKARAAALACGGLLSIPPFNEGETGNDWNDFYTINRVSWFPPKVEFKYLAVGGCSGPGGLPCLNPFQIVVRLAW